MHGRGAHRAKPTFVEQTQNEDCSLVSGDFLSNARMLEAFSKAKNRFDKSLGKYASSSDSDEWDVYKKGREIQKRAEYILKNMGKRIQSCGIEYIEEVIKNLNCCSAALETPANEDNIKALNIQAQRTYGKGSPLYQSFGVLMMALAVPLAIVGLGLAGIGFLASPTVAGVSVFFGGLSLLGLGIFAAPFGFSTFSDSRQKGWSKDMADLGTNLDNYSKSKSKSAQPK